MARINSEVETTELASSIVAVLPDKTEEAVNAFLDARFTPYDKATRTDAHLKLKAGKTYLPYPYNSMLVAKLHEGVASEVEEDPYDI